MEFGVVLPHVGPQAREHVVERIQAVTQQAEALGYHSIWVADHIVLPTHIASHYPYHPEGKFPVDPADNFLEPLTVLGYAAACTTRIRLGTGVLIIPYRHPVVTAKMIATLDVLSHGRIILTIKKFAEQAGRDPHSLTYAAPTYERTFDDVLRNLPRYQQVGLDHVVLAFFMWSEGFEEMLTLMERFAREVGLKAA